MSRHELPKVDEKDSESFLSVNKADQSTENIDKSSIKYPGFLEALQSSSLSLKDELTQGKTYFLFPFLVLFLISKPLTYFGLVDSQKSLVSPKLVTLAALTIEYCCLRINNATFGETLFGLCRKSTTSVGDNSSLSRFEALISLFERVRMF
jgi:hypothetical protein